MTDPITLRAREDSMTEGCTCHHCGEVYRVDIALPDDHWERIKPAGANPGAGLLCGACIMRAIEREGRFACYRLEAA